MFIKLGGVMRSLSGDTVFRLTWLSLSELQELLRKLHDMYSSSDRFNILKHLGNSYTDTRILPLLLPEKEFEKSNKSSEILADLKKCYVKESMPDNGNVIYRVNRGRKKSFKKTLKERVFELLDAEMLDYNGVLLAGVVDISENTFKTILSQYRTSKGINAKRGRKTKVVND